ncbi:glycosyltransferase family 4 protein [Maribacter sp. 2307ULW6-5]|uniref:glycosyltransferase family 4 protein n=1 Tax=Maribacter sp. 2307ULW6-5 TaxID=3386275 RepID=UPI0039BD554C
MSTLPTVCHLTTVHKRSDTRIFIKQCTALAVWGYNVHLVVADGLGNEEKEGVKIHDIGRPNGKLQRMLLFSSKIFKKAIKIDADIFHFHDPELMFVGGKLIGRGKRVVYDVHEDLPRQIFTKPYLPKFAMRLVSVMIEKLENKMAKKYDVIITATPHIRNRFLTLNKKTYVVHNYPLLSEYESITSRWEEKEQAICYIGGIYEVRGIYENIEALGSSGLKMILAGVFQPKEFQEKCEKSKGWKYVEFAGFVNREEMASILARSKAGMVTLHPTVNYVDSLPVKMFEYMAAGIPVIASNFKLWRTIVEGSECGICVDPVNTAEIAKAIKSILSNDSMAQQMGENGKKAVLERYNWEIEKKTLFKVYGGLTNKSLGIA